MDGFAVPVAELDAAATAASAVAAGVRGIDLAACAAAVAVALPGSRSAEAATRTAGTWTTTMTTAAEGLAAHATALTESVRAYRSTDTSIAHTFTGLVPGTTPPGAGQPVPAPPSGTG